MLHQLQVSEPGSSYFQGRLARTSVHRVLQQVCEGPQWRLELTPAAEKTLRAQSIQLNFSERSADLLFDLLLAPLEIVWTFEDGRLRILTETEMNPADLEKFRLNLAERMLFVALLSDPEHEQSPTAYLLLGNLAFQGGDLSTARRHFESILQTSPRSSVAAEAWFNAAKTAIAEGSMDRARQALLGAVDVARGNPLEPIALLLSARNALLFDEPLKAIRPLVRAVTLAADDDVRALSLLTLASAHLIAGHPESANLALMEDRRLLQHDPYRDRAALLGGLARFRSASTPWRVDRDGRSLIAAVSHIRTDDWVSLHDHLLTVESFEALGLTDLAVPILESAVQMHGPSPLRTRMQFRLAELYAGRGDSERAEIVLAAMTEDPSPEVASESMFKLADLHVRRKEADRAELICRDLLQQPITEARRIAVLRLLGGIYARRGDRERAVLCFSGVAPQLFEATLKTSPSETPANSPGSGGSPVSVEQEGGR
ncbi:MAG: tetratricopeptide repeat protein [Planctomycetaceae bacterium]